jgi:hypothetical protein
VNAIWASDIQEDISNPYIARNKSGMFCFGEYVFYNSNNMDCKNGHLILKHPMHKYEFSSDGFEKIENGKIFIMSDAEKPVCGYLSFMDGHVSIVSNEYPTGKIIF